MQDVLTIKVIGKMLYHGIRFALGYVSRDLKLKLLSLALGIKSIKSFQMLRITY